SNLVQGRHVRAADRWPAVDYGVLPCSGRSVAYSRNWRLEHYCRIRFSDGRIHYDDALALSFHNLPTENESYTHVILHIVDEPVDNSGDNPECSDDFQSYPQKLWTTMWITCGQDCELLAELLRPQVTTVYRASSDSVSISNAPTTVSATSTIATMTSPPHVLRFRLLRVSGVLTLSLCFRSAIRAGTEAPSPVKKPPRWPCHEMPAPRNEKAKLMTIRMVMPRVSAPMRRPIIHSAAKSP